MKLRLFTIGHGNTQIIFFSSITPDDLRNYWSEQDEISERLGRAKKKKIAVFVHRHASELESFGSSVVVNPTRVEHIALPCIMVEQDNDPTNFAENLIKASKVLYPHQKELAEEKRAILEEKLKTALEKQKESAEKSKEEVHSICKEFLGLLNYPRDPKSILYWKEGFPSQTPV